MIHDVAILGGGPAGSLLARLLAARGYAVLLRTLPPPAAPAMPWVEGLAPRAIARLEGAGAAVALAAATAPLPRAAHWGGLSNRFNQEALVDRHRFDAALLREAMAAGVTVEEKRVRGPLTAHDLGVRLVVEARGRQAPRRAVIRRGPRSVALVRAYAGGDRGRGETLLAAAPFGWVWAALPGDGTASVQLMLDATAERPSRARAAALFDAALARCPVVAERLAAFQAQGPVRGRDAGAVLAGQLATPESLRVGDAAFAIDPLAGHGLYEAIAGARAAEAVIATLLDHPDRSALAIRFHDARATDAFLRHARIGRDFYRLEQRWPDAPFWRRRRAWPDDAPAHAAPDSAPPRVAPMPVNIDGYVEKRPVIVTADHPRGVFSIAGVPLVPLLETPRDATPERLAAHFGVTPAEIATARAWLSQRRLSDAPAPDAGSSPAADRADPAPTQEPQARR